MDQILSTLLEMFKPFFTVKQTVYEPFCSCSMFLFAFEESLTEDKNVNEGFDKMSLLEFLIKKLKCNSIFFRGIFSYLILKKTNLLRERFNFIRIINHFFP